MRRSALILLCSFMIMVATYGCSSYNGSALDKQDGNEVAVTDVTTSSVKPTSTPTPTPSLTPTPVPTLDKEQVRNIVADAITYSFVGKEIEDACRYDVNGDGTDDLILHDVGMTMCVSYSDGDKVRINSFDIGNSGVEYYCSSARSELVMVIGHAVPTYSASTYYSFHNNGFHEDAVEILEMYDFEKDEPLYDGREVYKINDNEVSKKEFDDFIKQYGELIELCPVAEFRARQTDIPSEFIPEAAEYIVNDIFGEPYFPSQERMDLNDDGIEDCYISFARFRVDQLVGIDYNGEIDPEWHEWMPASIVLLSTTNGIEARIYETNDCVDFINSMIG